MPYDIKYMPNTPPKRDRPWKIINKDKHKIVGTALTEEAARLSVHARLAGAHGWRGKR